MITCPNCSAEIDDDSRFCDQCGTALTRCTLRCPALGLTVEAANDMLLGRKAGPCAEQLAPQRFVSGKHAQLHFQAAKGWCIEDLGSTNGTFIDGTQLKPGLLYPLHDGTKVALADIEFTAEIKN